MEINLLTVPSIFTNKMCIYIYLWLKVWYGTIFIFGKNLYQRKDVHYSLSHHGTTFVTSNIYSQNDSNFKTADLLLSFMVSSNGLYHLFSFCILCLVLFSVTFKTISIMKSHILDKIKFIFSYFLFYTENGTVQKNNLHAAQNLCHIRR